jgi:hypothetical protein
LTKNSLTAIIQVVKEFTLRKEYHLILNQLKETAQPFDTAPEGVLMRARATLYLDFSPEFAKLLCSNMTLLDGTVWVKISDAIVMSFHPFSVLDSNNNYTVLVQGTPYILTTFHYTYHDNELLEIIDNALKENNNAK